MFLEAQVAPFFSFCQSPSYDFLGLGRLVAVIHDLEHQKTVARTAFESGLETSP